MADINHWSSNRYFNSPSKRQGRRVTLSIYAYMYFTFTNVFQVRFRVDQFKLYDKVLLGSSIQSYFVWLNVYFS